MNNRWNEVDPEFGSVVFKLASNMDINILVSKCIRTHGSCACFVGVECFGGVGGVVTRRLENTLGHPS